MSYQNTFKRYEVKYLLTKTQRERLRQIMKGQMRLDEYGRTTIRNIYYDTDQFRLIRRSLEKPSYKEKLRLRSYAPAEGEDPIFVELKKKYKNVVYKRRLVLPCDRVMTSFREGTPFPDDSQIGREIEYFREFYGTLRPAVFLSYEREAYYDLSGSDFRVTFDENILFRSDNLTLGGEVYGNPLLREGQSLMEVKTGGGMPLWMTRFLTREKIFKTSFSKYGAAYLTMTAQENQGGHRYA